MKTILKIIICIILLTILPFLNMKELLKGFLIGTTTFLLIFEITYYTYWSNFKLKAKQYNLKVSKCELCKNSFYTYNTETTKICCNCILIEYKKDIKEMIN